MTDDTDRDLACPRLEVRIRQTEAAYWLHIWLRENDGEQRRELLNGKQAASLAEAHEIIRDCAMRHSAEPPAPDDIAIDRSPD